MKAKGERIVCLTAYDVVSGAIADAAGVDLVLVGDSLGNAVLGYENTLPVSLEQMAHHTAAVRRGVHKALLVADLPFGTFQSSVSSAVEAAVTLVKAGAEAVKLEGTYTDEIRAIIKAGIPVMGHVGMTPQSVNQFGGFRVQGKGAHGQHVLECAQQIEAAGVFALVLELIPATVACRITTQLKCPTIGIGAGPECDGEIQVFTDVVGLSEETFRHAKRYAEGRSLFTEAASRYAEEVRARTFPTEENSL
jgi:3-methyl-2-oxobutanoate hydroxymethyltransferase